MLVGVFGWRVRLLPLASEYLGTGRGSGGGDAYPSGRVSEFPIVFKGSILKDAVAKHRKTAETTRSLRRPQLQQPEQLERQRGFSGGVCAPSLSGPSCPPGLLRGYGFAAEV